MRWTILGPAGCKIVPSGKVPLVQARCACGTVQVIDPRSIKRGLSKSCGCWRDEKASRVIQSAGRALSVKQWAELSGIAKTTIHRRIRNGISPQIAVFACARMRTVRIDPRSIAV